MLTCKQIRPICQNLWFWRSKNSFRQLFVRKASIFGVKKYRFWKILGIKKSMAIKKCFHNKKSFRNQNALTSKMNSPFKKSLESELPNTLTKKLEIRKPDHKSLFWNKKFPTNQIPLISKWIYLPNERFGIKKNWRQSKIHLQSKRFCIQNQLTSNTNFWLDSQPNVFE